MFVLSAVKEATVRATYTAILLVAVTLTTVLLVVTSITSIYAVKSRSGCSISKSTADERVRDYSMSNYD